MKTGRFHHTVRIQVEITGLDLVILEYHAKRHYDGTCRRFFEPANDIRDRDHDGYVWIQDWMWQDWKARFGHLEEKTVEEGEYRHPSEALEQTVTVNVTSRMLDLCLKIIERLGAEDSWRTVEYLTGIKMPNHFELDGGTATGMSPEEFETALRKSVLFWKDTPIEKKMSELVPPLRAGLKEAFDRIQKEWWRLEEESKPAPEFDGELKCPNCSGDNLEWQEYVLETRQILGVVDDELAVDLASARQEFECSKDEGLACKDCYHEFRVPQGLDVDHVEREDFEAKVR